MKEAKRRFVERNTMNDSIDLTNGSDFSHLIEFNKKDSCHLTLDENLDFFNRQVKYVAPHVLLQGYSYKLPFLDLDFYNFMLGVRSKYRINKKLYKKILLRNYQNMFDLPVKENYGLSLNSTKLNIFLKKTIVSRLGNKELNVNYANFHKMYTANLNFRDLVKSNLIDLKNRGVVNWIDPLEILQKVSQTDSRYFNTILVLVSLEIHLKTGKEI